MEPTNTEVVSRDLTVQNPEGLHLRPAGKLARLATEYNCSLELERCGQIADCRSMISLMTLGASQGSVLTLRASGPDADSAVEAIARLFESRFDEL